MLSSNGGHQEAKETVEIIKANDDKKVKWIYEFKHKLIIFTYYLKLFLILSHFIKLFYKTYLIYLMI